MMLQAKSDRRETDREEEKVVDVLKRKLEAGVWEAEIDKWGLAAGHVSNETSDLSP